MAPAPPHTDPVDRIRQALHDRGLAVRNDRGHKFTAQCPAHDDHTPSLDVATGSDGKALLICRSAGCPTPDILAALDLNTRDLFPSTNGTRADVRAPDPGPPRTLETTYLYTSDGEPLIRKNRYRLADGSKTFTISHRKTPTSRWATGQAGLPADPYRWADWADTDPHRAIFIVEGEKDADRLASLGLQATTNISGAPNTDTPKWPDNYGPQFFAGRNIIILPDNDTPGQLHAQHAAANIHPHAASVRIIQLPDLPPKGDISDWLDLEHTLADLHDLADTTPLWTPQPPPQSRFRLLTIKDLYQLPEPGWLIEHILPAQSFGLLVAPPKQGKTYLILDWGLHIAAGHDWHTGAETAQGHVIYITGEGTAGLPRRIRAWTSHNGHPDTLEHHFHIVTTMPRIARDGELDEQRQQIDTQLAGTQPALIIFDTYSRLSAGLDENSASDMGNVCAHLEALRDDYRCTVLVAHHTTKDGQEFRGSSAIDGAVDFMARCKIDQSKIPTDPDELVIKCARMKDWEEFEPITLQLHRSHNSGFLLSEPLSRGQVAHSLWILNCRVHTPSTGESSDSWWIPTKTIRDAAGLTRQEAHQVVKALLRDNIIELRGSTTNREVRWTETGWLQHCRATPHPATVATDSPTQLSRGGGGYVVPPHPDSGPTDEPHTDPEPEGGTIL